ALFESYQQEIIDMNQINLKDDGQVREIKIQDIDPNIDQPRKDFDEESIEELVKSIKEHGILQPILLKPNSNGRYTIIAGERRWRAARLAGLDRIPAIIRDIDDSEMLILALVENL